MSEKFGHERLAEPHYLGVGFTFWIEIRATLAATHRQTRQRIFKNLFEREELNDAGRNRRMKTQPALIWTERAIHLYAKTAVHLYLAFVVDPRNPELNHALWFNKAL